MMRSIVVLVAGGLLSICALPAHAQDAILGQMYGNGVHAYFGGDYPKAHRLLTSAIDAGSRDPRCYYFRGLAYLNLGRPQEAEGDFQQGAKLETGDLNRIYSVAKSLERVQGPARLELEQYRAAARMAALEQAEKLRKQRYEELNREERRVLESQAGPAPARSAGAEVAPPPEAKMPENPFAAPPAPSGEKPAEGPSKARSQPAAEPAGEAKKADEEPKPAAPENPFGAAKQGGPEVKKPAAENADPFATPPEKPAAKKPAAPAKKAAAEKPAAKKAAAGKGAAKKAADSADPFAN